jgi:ABC-2 type transport system permease protein
MITALRRSVSVYVALAAAVPKNFLAYSLWFWIGLILNTIQMMVFVFFWRGVYANTDTISGLDLRTTLNYILLAQVFNALTDTQMLWEIGQNLREGNIAHVLLRPLDIQGSYYVISLAHAATGIIWQIPMAVIATVFFGLSWPLDPAVWGAFLITALLGRTVLFFFDYLLAGLTFYTTEVWGLAVLIFGAGLFLSGAMVPLEIMPGWLRTVVLALPFAQTLAVPISILSGIQPLSEAPRLWLIQLAWIGGLAVASRAFFNFAVRKVTVQGG